MTPAFIITGTDTGVGKTAFSAMLMLGLEKHGGANYWKPIQCGVAEGIDTRIAQNLTGLPNERFFPERYILTEPLSPHRAAEIDGVEIDIEELANAPPLNPPRARGGSEGALIIEGAGGLMVPLTRRNLQVNLFRRWNLPVILCARTGLGTINHTLLSLEALWSRGMPVHGIAFIGEEIPDTMDVIAELSGEKILGRMPWIDDLNADSLKRAFDMNFDAADFSLSLQGEGGEPRTRSGASRVRGGVG